MRRSVIAVLGLCLFLAELGCSAEEPTPQDTYELLYRAARAVEGAIVVGVTQTQFGEHLQRLSTEVLVATDRSSSVSEIEMVNAYRDLLATYMDSATLWKHRGEYGWYLFEGGSTAAVCLPIADKYGIEPIKERDHHDLPASAVQDVWEVASQKAEATAELYLNLGNVTD